MDPANAAQVAKGGGVFTFARTSIEPNLPKIADLDRPGADVSVQDAVVKKWSAAWHTEPAAFEKLVTAERDAARRQVLQLAGKTWQAKAKAVVDYADARKLDMSIDGVLGAMLKASSDYTEGDMVVAAMVYAVAASEQHPMTQAVAQGDVKVDQVKNEKDGGINDPHYIAEAGGRDKGDTIYVPPHFTITNLADRSQVIHELNHVADDSRTSPGNVGGYVLSMVELDAYRAQARYILDQIVAMPQGDARDEATTKVGAIMKAPLGFALIRESRRDKKRFEPVLLEINQLSPANRKPSLGELATWMAMSDVDLEIEAEKAIRVLYDLRPEGKQPNKGLSSGLAGEHDVSKM